MGLVAIGAILFAVLLLVAAGMVWQELRKLPEPQATYIVEEAVPFVYQRLSDQALTRIDDDDVLRILEWEVFYLQGLDIPRDHETRPAPVAGSEEAIDFIEDQTAGHGYPYQRTDISEVLEHEAAYLMEIGAVGSPVEGEPT